MKPPNSLGQVAAILLVSLRCAIPPCSASEANWATVKPLAFSDVNEQVRENYVHAKQEIREGLGPIILCTSDLVSLLKGNRKTTVPFIKPRFTGLKEITHITLGTFILLRNHTNESLGPDTIQRLRNYKDGIEKADLVLNREQGLEPVDESRQKELIKKTISFLGTVIKDKLVSREDLRQYVRSCTASDLENAYEAAGSEIKTIDDAVSKWHKAMSPEEWKMLHVIIWTTHMPKQDLASFQYFSKLLNQPNEGDQIIVAESPSPCDEEQAIELLVTHILDREIALEFFNDPSRMHRDLLADGAKEYLQKHDLQGNQPK